MENFLQEALVMAMHRLRLPHQTICAFWQGGTLSLGQA